MPASCRVRTPATLARAMVSAVGVDGDWLEPAAADGVFLQAARELDGRRTLLGLELEPGPWSPDVRGGIEFLSWSTQTAARFDVVVGNPPYARLARVSSEVRNSATSVPVEPGCEPIDGRANLWYAFVVASLRVLRAGGCMAWLLPAAWEYADYAKPLRELLPSLFGELITIRARKPLCEGVEDASVVLIARSWKARPERVDRYEVPDLAGVLRTLERLEDTSRAPASTSVVPGAQGSQALGDLVDLEIGAVTGSTRYFLLTEERRRTLSLPGAAVRPVLSRHSHLSAGVVDHTVWSALRDAGERVWLFSPGDQIDQATADYLALPPDAGGCDRGGYKISRRDPWYQVPLPRVPDAFLSPSVASGVRFSLSGLQGLTATNTLYTVRFRHDLAWPDRCTLALALLSKRVTDWVAARARRYPGGLQKLEPSDFLELPVPACSVRADAAERLQLACELLSEGNEARARCIAEDVVLPAVSSS